jgi:hypothetical protein
VGSPSTLPDGSSSSTTTPPPEASPSAGPVPATPDPGRH